MNTSASAPGKRPLDVCIRGSGAVGASLALALNRLGWQVGLVAPQPSAPRGPDVRTYALNAASMRLLRELRVWDALPADAVTPVDEMRIAGDAGGQLGFSAWQQAVGALAWIVDAAALDAALAEALRYAPHVQCLNDNAPAALLAVCEGRDSATRDALGARYVAQPYGHHAVAARLVADAPHLGVARQWFRSPDILALLPFDRPAPGASYGLVWSMPEALAAERLAQSPADFEAALNAATGGAAGTLRLDGARASWPLMLARAERWCGPGWVLLGDAAHAVHPLSGQGLNLGLADVAALVQVLAEARAASPWRSTGDERTLRRYARARQAPTRAMGALTDGLLHLFAQTGGVLPGLRNQGLSLVDGLPPLKRWLAARALDA